LAADPAAWRHGYDVGLQTGLKAGSLYPILIRLADRGLLEARWEPAGPPGRPPRHLYRLTPAGLEVALAHSAAAGSARGRSAAAARSARSARANGAAVPRLGWERG
jgi:DNA-binding PadR family transcriptional regulator